MKTQLFTVDREFVRCAASTTIIMTKLLHANKQFLYLLLHTSKDQAAALLDSITSDQVLFLSEIAKNFLHLPLPRKGRHLVDSKRKLFENLANKKVKKEQKLKIIKKNYRHLLFTLWSVKAQLMQLL